MSEVTLISSGHQAALSVERNGVWAHCLRVEALTAAAKLPDWVGVTLTGHIADLEGYRELEALLETQEWFLVRLSVSGVYWVVAVKPRGYVLKTNTSYLAELDYIELTIPRVEVLSL